jgi:hypothetical protein
MGPPLHRPCNQAGLAALRPWVPWASYRGKAGPHRTHGAPSVQSTLASHLADGPRGGLGVGQRNFQIADPAFAQ